MHTGIEYVSDDSLHSKADVSGTGFPVPPAIELLKINKRFGTVHANKDIDLSIQAGSITGIIGENGAGKSTLVSMLFGFYTADSGDILINGNKVEMTATSDAIRLGIGMVHQHFMLVPTMSVLENVMLGREGSFLLEPGEARTRETLAALSRDYGLEVDPDTLVEDLPVGLQQRVEILKALLCGAQILILDEPTGVLTPQEADRLFEILRLLKRDGVTVLLITHKLQEIMAVTDAVCVMRHGEVVAQRQTCDTSRKELARLMVGRDVLFSAKYHTADPGPIALEAQNLTFTDSLGAARLSDVSFHVRAGEILGIAGVSGNGQSELLDILSGIAPIQEGEVKIAGESITRDHPMDAYALRRLGLAHIPEDRHRRGMVLNFTAAESAILGYHHFPVAGDGKFLDLNRIQTNCAGLMAEYDVRPPVPKLRSGGFSGGNQQKIVVAREIAAVPAVLLIGQPTRGVDIGAIEFIHQRIIEMRDAGCAIVLVSVELDEIMSLSDRILVMNAGRIVGETDHTEADANRIGLMMAGIDPNSYSVEEGLSA